MSGGSRWQRTLAQARGTQLWEVAIRLLLDRARTARGEDLRSLAPQFEHLAEFVEEFGRMAGNYGTSEGEGPMRALDRLIELRRRDGNPTTRLELAKARYLANVAFDNPEREVILRRAIGVATQRTELWAEAMEALAWYYVDVSRYDLALRTIERLRAGIEENPRLVEFRRCVAAITGVALFTSFRDLRRAEASLQQAVAGTEAVTDPQVMRWVATAHHYLGRLAEIRRHYRSALDHYLAGQHCQDRCPEEIKADAFVDLRLSEVLTSVGRLDQARDHLEACNRLFELSDEVTSGRLQAMLGFASLEAAEGRLDVAFATAQSGRQEARRIGYWRGELLCLGYELSLAVRSHRARRILGLLWAIARTIRGGELGRLNVMRILIRVPMLVGIVLRRMSGRRPDIPADELVDSCPCPMHGAGTWASPNTFRFRATR